MISRKIKDADTLRYNLRSLGFTPEKFEVKEHGICNNENFYSYQSNNFFITIEFLGREIKCEFLERLPNHGFKKTDYNTYLDIIDFLNINFKKQLRKNIIKKLLNDSK